MPLLALASAQTGKLGDALAVENNPAGASYIASLPEKAGTSLRGYVLATSGANGKGVNFAVNLVGLPSEGGPFRKSLTFFHTKRATSHRLPVAIRPCCSVLTLFWIGSGKTCNAKS